MGTQAAVIYEQSGPFVIEDVELDALRPDEILVRIEGAGICHTDLLCRDLVYPIPLPTVLGHEGAGVVEQIGDRVAGIDVGDHVVLSFSACGTCVSCLQGVPSRCAEIFPCNFSCTRADGSSTLRGRSGTLHGSFFKQSSFATLAVASAASAVRVGKDVPLELLGPLGCGIQTGAGAVMNTLKPAPASSLAIFGCGTVGLSAIMAARVVGCTRIVAVDPLAPRRDLALELGATDAVDPAVGDPVQGVHDATAGGADYSLECTGIPDCIASVPGFAAWNRCLLRCRRGAAGRRVFDRHQRHHVRSYAMRRDRRQLRTRALYSPTRGALFGGAVPDRPADKLLSTHGDQCCDRRYGKRQSGKAGAPARLRLTGAGRVAASDRDARARYCECTTSPSSNTVRTWVSLMSSG